MPSRRRRKQLQTHHTTRTHASHLRRHTSNNKNVRPPAGGNESRTRTQRRSGGACQPGKNVVCRWRSLVSPLCCPSCPRDCGVTWVGLIRIWQAGNGGTSRRRAILQQPSETARKTLSRSSCRRQKKESCDGDGVLRAGARSGKTKSARGSARKMGVVKNVAD